MTRRANRATATTARRSSRASPSRTGRCAGGHASTSLGAASTAISIGKPPCAASEASRCLQSATTTSLRCNARRRRVIAPGRSTWRCHSTAAPTFRRRTPAAATAGMCAGAHLRTRKLRLRELSPGHEQRRRRAAARAVRLWAQRREQVPVPLRRCGRDGARVLGHCTRRLRCLPRAVAPHRKPNVARCGRCDQRYADAAGRAEPQRRRLHALQSDADLRASPQLHALSPSTGPSDGGTRVVIHGAFAPVNKWECRFGDGAIVPAARVNMSNSSNGAGVAIAPSASQGGGALVCQAPSMEATRAPPDGLMYANLTFAPTEQVRPLALSSALPLPRSPSSVSQTHPCVAALAVAVAPHSIVSPRHAKVHPTRRRPRLR